MFQPGAVWWSLWGGGHCFQWFASIQGATCSRCKGVKRRCLFVCLFVCLSVCPVEGHLACLKMDCSLFFKVIGTWQEREFTRYGSWPCVWERFSMSKTGGDLLSIYGYFNVEDDGSMIIHWISGVSDYVWKFHSGKKNPKWFTTSCGWIWPREYFWCG